MANEDSISRKAVKFVIGYERKNDRDAIDMQTNSSFKGFDVLSFSKDKKDIRSIEVKGTQIDNGIPDLFETELTRNKKLIATHLYVVKFNKKKDVISLFIVPADKIKSEYFKETRHYRICSTFKTKELDKYKEKI
jgi:hypothetical protein